MLWVVEVHSQPQRPRLLSAAMNTPTSLPLSLKNLRSDAMHYHSTPSRRSFIGQSAAAAGCKSGYFHPGLKAGEFFGTAEDPAWRYGIPPMFYPAHCTAHLISLTRERLVEVACNGWGDAHPILKKNPYNNPKLKLGGDRGADFAGFVRESVGWGVTFARGPATVMAKWSWHGEQKNGAFAALGPVAFNYVAPRTDLDLSLDYQLEKRLSVFLNIRNVFDERSVQRRCGSETPAYARTFNTAEFGAQWAAGIKGSF